MILNEAETLDRIVAGASLARFGDGELRVALGGNCVSQVADPRLAAELREALKHPGDCLVAVPRPGVGPNAEAWKRYHAGAYRGLYNPKVVYGSSLITRPDSAPWIDRPAYWERVRSLWRRRDVVLVAGTDRSLVSNEMGDASSVELIRGPETDAYREIDALTERLAGEKRRVLLCLGAAATVLAWRLANRGVNAIDLGHIGMFMRQAGAYRYARDDLVSPRYRALLERQHASEKGWGGDGAKHVANVKEAIQATEATCLLDYGAGIGELRKALAPFRVDEYEPSHPKKRGLPKPHALTICTDVLEHVEPDRLMNVLDHLRRVTTRRAYLVIATRPAKRKLADGRNAHLIVEDAAWWLSRLKEAGWRVERFEDDAARELRVWATPTT